MDDDLRDINIAPTASAKGLREKLDRQARRRGLNFRQMVGDILTYASKKEHRKQFQGPLKDPLPEDGGEHIGSRVSSEVKDTLTAWAKERKVSRGIHCRYILEKAIEDDLFDTILGTSSSKNP